MFYFIHVLLRLFLAVFAGGFVVVSIWFPSLLEQGIQEISTQGIEPPMAGFVLLGITAFLFLADVVSMTLLDDTQLHNKNKEKVRYIERLLQNKGPRPFKTRGLIPENQWGAYIDRIEQKLGTRPNLTFRVTTPDEHGIQQVILNDTSNLIEVKRPFSSKKAAVQERLIKEQKLEAFHIYANKVLSEAVVDIPVVVDSQ